VTFCPARITCAAGTGKDLPVWRGRHDCGDVLPDLSPVLAKPPPGVALVDEARPKRWGVGMVEVAGAQRNCRPCSPPSDRFCISGHAKVALLGPGESLLGPV